MTEQFKQNCKRLRWQWLIEVTGKMMLVCLLGLLSLNCASASPEEVVPQTSGPRYQVEIATVAHEGYWKSPQLRLGPLVLAYVAVKDLHCEASKPARYEVLFYSDKHCLGCKRLCRLPAAAGAEVVIRYGDSSRDYSCARAHAAAGAIARMIVDCHLNDNPVGHVTIPSESFQAVTGELRRYGFVAKEARVNQLMACKAMICVESEPPGSMLKLYL